MKMKKVIIKVENELVEVSNVDEEKYYGMQGLHSNKGFVVQSQFKSGNFKILSSESFTYGNGWSDYENNNLISMFNRILKDNKTIYEFDTSKELFKWLSED